MTVSTVARNMAPIKARGAQAREGGGASSRHVRVRGEVVVLTVLLAASLRKRLQCHAQLREAGAEYETRE